MATTADRVHFGHWEGVPIRWTATEGWMFNLSTYKWEPVHPAECAENGRLLSKEEYEARFRDIKLTKLPTAAFGDLDTEEG